MTTLYNKMSLIVAATGAVLAMAAQSAQAQPSTYAIDPSHTYVTFEISHFGTSTNRGRFDKKDGSVQFDRAGKSGKVEIVIDTTSINSGFAAFDKHLKSAEILNTEAHPSAKFVSDKFTFNGDKVSEVAGQLTLNGKTNPVTLKATNFNCYQNPMLKREVCGGDFDSAILRGQYRVSWGLNYGLPDNVHLVMQLEAIKQ